MTQDFFIILKGKDRTRDIERCALEGGILSVVFKGNPQVYTYKQENFTLIKRATSYHLFNYLQEICTLIEIQTPEGNLNVLAKEYSKILSIPQESALFAYLNPLSLQTQTRPLPLILSPFGLNKSQYQALQNALQSQISIIEGPPGTGKTQSILNIIANLIYHNKSVAVLSNNNSATQNVFEKLSCYGFDYCCATLGKKENKEHFISHQRLSYPNGESFALSKIELEENIAKYEQKALESFELTNTIAQHTQSLNALQLEYEYFKAQETPTHSQQIQNLKLLKSDKILKIKVQIEEREHLPSWLKLKFVLWDRVGDLRFYKLPKEEILNTLDEYFYILKISELSKSLESAKARLEILQKDNPLQKLTENSLALLKLTLQAKYQPKAQRMQFSLEDLYHNASSFLKEYPIILSTTHSIKSSLNLKGELFDYVIIDESSQVDLVSGFLALSVAKNAVIVGDTKQLPNVIAQDKIQAIESLSKKHTIPANYDFATQSLLSSIIATLPNTPKILLREHYRCHPKIIGFCNQKFYNNELIILSEDKGEKDVMQAFITQAGNHARRHYNQRQIDVIEKEILPPLREKLESAQIGIISPYRKQKAYLQQAIKDIQIDTIHKFQGREKGAIILSSVDNEINDFINDANLLNVAVSRAKQYFRVVVSAQICNSVSHLNDLVQYMHYHNFEITQSQVKSVFDLLYKANQNARLEYLKSKKRISMYDSENIAYHALKECIGKDLSLDIATHIPLYRILNNTQALSDEEQRFIASSSHIDLLVFSTMNKRPLFAIEVDGFAYHQKDSKQSERDKLKNGILQKYQLPLLRLSTIGSGEVEKIKEALRSIRF
ncbi:DUF2726 domain-containing protein [Helicobacter sp. MIT 05-5293]|uniref:AAA domain-containing protein n=1 Tax=Helicobacter sp. MIT 05-5293 TaxID=1548149 RepID=UPI00068B4DE1|nr:AAA domain-containing protein [Helicobacter sp. MIT 05-5293]TLD80898.1 DUF2726 domain-containing protein [Helicobacter sp. MIT 05-5293]